LNRRSLAGLRDLPRPGAGPSRADLAVGAEDRAPLPYPSGWFCPALSREVPAGAVVNRRFMGRDVVLYRTRGGVPRVVAAHCPHLGAGGAVHGEHPACPFHRFAFDVEGACVRAPGGTPPRAALGQYPVRERGRVVHVWHGHDAVPPSGEPSELPDDRFAPAATSTWSTVLTSAPQEVMESFVDYAHQAVVHNVALREVKPPLEDGPLVRIAFGAATRLCVGLGTIRVEQGPALSGLGLASGEVTFHQIGVTLGVAVTATPVGPWRTRLRVVIMTDAASRPHSPLLRKAAARSLSAVAGQALMRTVVHHMVQYARIRNRKRYLPDAALTSEQGATGQYRGSVGRFYPLEAPADRT
jgi:cholesterol 7-dehydrogenase